MAEDNKAEQSLNLKVKGADGQEVFFKVKRNTPFDKIIKAYAKRQGQPPNQIRFLFDGDRIHNDQTPADFNMEDEDEIDAMQIQTGGAL